VTALDCAALLLDVDGTLVDSTAAGERAWQRWAREYGVDEAEVLRGLHGRRSVDTVRRFLPSDAADEALDRQQRLEIADLDGVVALPGAAELLAALRRPDTMPWALVSSGDARLVATRMAAAGLPLAEVIVTAESVREGKPDPEGYRLAAERLGVAARACVVVEDAPAGIAAGRGATATVVAVTTTFAADVLRDADVVVPSLHQLRPGAGTLTIAPG
jgi:mannitol-1-/sugar-/sorbitol-6-phosphatase